MNRLASELGRLARLLGNPSQQARGAVSASASLSELQSKIDTFEIERAEPIRTLHHFACTGGTLIAKCIAAMPNVHLLSEVDPLSTLIHRKEQRFHPTDLIELLRFGSREVSQEELIEVFTAGLSAVCKMSDRSGRRLVLRDHAHSHYCHVEGSLTRPSLLQMVKKVRPTRSVVTVRHPVESYLSLRRNKWLHFSPPTFEEYSRRYLMFLDEHASLPVVRYEDFVVRPQETMVRICDLLSLPFSSSFQQSFRLQQLSGDSGRSSGVIRPRAKKLLRAELLSEVDGSKTGQVLLARLGY